MNSRIRPFFVQACLSYHGVCVSAGLTSFGATPSIYFYLAPAGYRMACDSRCRVVLAQPGHLLSPVATAIMLHSYCQQQQYSRGSMTLKQYGTGTAAAASTKVAPRGVAPHFGLEYGLLGLQQCCYFQASYVPFFRYHGSTQW